MQDLEKNSFSVEDKLKFQIQIYHDYGTEYYEKKMWDKLTTEQHATKTFMHLFNFGNSLPRKRSKKKALENYVALSKLLLEKKIFSAKFFFLKVHRLIHNFLQLFFHFLFRGREFPKLDA